MKAFLFYIGLTFALLVISLAIHALPTNKQGAAIMGALFVVAVGFLVRLCRG